MMKKSVKNANLKMAETLIKLNTLVFAINKEKNKYTNIEQEIMCKNKNA